MRDLGQYGREYLVTHQGLAGNIRQAHGMREEPTDESGLFKYNGRNDTAPEKTGLSNHLGYIATASRVETYCFYRVLAQSF